MTWRAPEIIRDDEPHLADERTALEGWLDYHRQTLLTKCAGLTAEQLRTPSVEPSPLTLLGLVRHMAEVEAWWFRENFAGQRVEYPYFTPEHPDADHDVSHADAEADLATYHREVALARAATVGRHLDETFTEVTPKRRQFNLRWVYLHMIEEYARHNGHADLIRERIDGTTGD
ncbi:Mini-circle protein [Micromonospora rosaria]|uniref:Mini-circle protein n=1 Tax=Micromonospora rosaria TaxID=47874 RepID=A0A136PJJ9_9ACTN|nr:DinB family protein [Micromonospora rosaria]KXK58602.1 Mini-circle protein [Micromonospora rosaria]